MSEQVWYRIQFSEGSSVVGELKNGLLHNLPLDHWKAIGASLTIVTIYSKEELEERILEEKKIIEQCLRTIEDQRVLLEESHSNQLLTINSLIGMVDNLNNVVPSPDILSTLISLTNRAYSIYKERGGDEEEKSILYKTQEWLTKFSGMKEVEVRNESPV